MNEKIKELITTIPTDSSGRWVYVGDMEKFAELIVKECAKSANGWYQNHNEIHWDPATYILANFGVEDVSN